jgi:hypothetical protein
VQSQDFVIAGQWTRFELSLKNEISLAPLNIYFATQIAIRQKSDIAIAFPQIEEGLYATSAIPPDTPLPAISNSPDARGATRDADRIWLDRAKTGFVIDSSSTTAIIVAKPNPNTDQIMDDQFLAFLSFWSSGASTEISVGISGQHDARFVIRLRQHGKDEFTQSTIIGGCELYFVCMVFDRNTLSVIINGAIAFSLVLEKSIVFDRTYIGCSHGQNPDCISGHIKQYSEYSTPLLYPRILELYRESCPNHRQDTYDYMMQYFRYSMTTGSEIATFDACLADEGFSYFVRQLDFSIPKIFTQFAPGGVFKEDNIRDWVEALMNHPGAHTARETYSKIGRTDLSLGYSFPVEGDPSAPFVERTYRIEFKIWGRRGYKKPPSQPLKYMSEDELTCAFVMIDRRSNPKMLEFENFVKNNIDYPCIAIREIPILKSDVKYFVSFHDDPRYRSARMVLNIYVPIVA